MRQHPVGGHAASGDLRPCPGQIPQDGPDGKGQMVDHCTVIAEAGVNHNGDPAIALDLIDRAAEAGADFVKFQTFRAVEIASRNARKADYQQRTTGGGESQLDMLLRLELSEAHHHDLVARCRARGIGFLSTPFDLPSLGFLTGELGLGTIKIGSGDLTNGPLLLATARAGVRILLSTGMASLSEVEEALGVIALGIANGRDDRTAAAARPGRAAFAAALQDPAVWPVLQDRVTLLHCTTEYPAPVAETNLRAIDTLRAAFGTRVGYSDHTDGNTVSFAAAARGADVIEKHFTLDRNLPGPDDAAPLEPPELAQLVRGLRAIGQALGTGIKQPGLAELANRPIARRSLHAATDLPAGHVLTAADLRVQRPATGIGAMAFWDIQGRVLDRPVAAGELIPPPVGMDTDDDTSG